MSTQTVKFKNYTGHDLLDLTTGVKYPAGDKVARSRYIHTPIAYSEEGSPIYEFSWSKPVGLPEPEDGIVCIVSSVVFNAVKHYCNNDGIMFPKCCIVNNSRFNEGVPYGCFGFKFNG